MQTRAGLPLTEETILRVIDRIDASPELSARLDELDKQALRSQFLTLYEAESNLE